MSPTAVATEAIFIVTYAGERNTGAIQPQTGYAAQRDAFVPWLSLVP
jgi:hypothetical protein